MTPEEMKAVITRRALLSEWDQPGETTDDDTDDEATEAEEDLHEALYLLQSAEKRLGQLTAMARKGRVPTERYQKLVVELKGEIQLYLEPWEFHE